MSLFFLLGFCLYASFAVPAAGKSTPTPSPTPTDTPTPLPSIRWAQFWGDLGHSPIELVSSGTGRDGNGEPEQCVTFRNVSDKVATSVTFGFAYNDPHGNALVTKSRTFTGTYTSPFQGSQGCTDFHLGEDNISNIGGVDVHALSVYFTDGSRWTSGQGFTRTYTSNGDKLPQPVTVAAYSPYELALTTTLPPLKIAQHWADAGQAPIEIVHSGTDYPFGSGMPWQCVNFRNVSDKVATNITFSFEYTNGSSTALASQQYDLSGTFTSPVEIDKKCVSVYPGSNDTLSQITTVNMHVVSVLFKDGTQWTPGAPFVHKYDATGAALAP